MQRYEVNATLHREARQHEADALSRSGIAEPGAGRIAAERSRTRRRLVAGFAPRLRPTAVPPWQGARRAPRGAARTRTITGEEGSRGAAPHERGPGAATRGARVTALPGRSGRQDARGESSSYRWWLLLVTSIGALLASLTSGHAGHRPAGDPARPPHGPLRLLWIVVGYTLVVTVLVLNAGRLADMFGRTRTYTLGFVVFTAASVFCAIAPDAAHADRRAARPGRRRRVHVRQLDRPGDRRVPARPSSAGPSASTPWSSARA